MPEQWLTTKEAAAFLGVALPTVQKWIQNGQIQAKRMGQKKWLLSRESLSSQLERFGAKAVSAFLTVEQAARRYQVSKLSLLAAIKEGELPFQTLGDGRYWRRYLDPKDVVAWKKARVIPARKVAPLASHCPSTGPSHYDLAEASRLVNRSVTCLRSAIRKGLLRAEGSRIARADLEDWLQKLRFRSGQSHDQDLLSLKIAAQQARVSPDVLRRAILKGELDTESNPAGKPLVAPAELQRWLDSRATADPSQLGPGKHYRLREIAELTQLNLATVQKDVVKGLLKADLMAGAPPYHLVSEANLVAWLKARNQKYTQPKLESEMLSTREACERFGVTQDILSQGRKLGRLQVARRFACNGVGLYYSSQEVEQYLEERSRPSAWTRTRITEFFGISPEAVREAMLQGDLPFDMRDLPGKGPRRCVTPENLIEWIRHQAPPYRLEVAHLGPLVSYQTAARLSNRSYSAIHAALCAGELSGLRLGHDEAGYHIPRYQFDLWLARQGLPPSWELETDSPWLRIPDAAQLARVAPPTIQKWLTVGHLEGKRRGRRWLVDRERLLEVADSYHAAREKPKNDRLTLARVANLTGLSQAVLEQAIQRQELQAGIVRQPGAAPLRVINTESLLRWLEAHAPPYRKEVAQLPPLLSSKLAGKLSGLGQTSVVKALRAGEFSAITVEERTGPRHYIPRCQLDKWLKSRGLPRSWELSD